MKPERIQNKSPTEKRTWGRYHTFFFSKFSKATNFSNFVTDMATNYGVHVNCSIDSRHNQLTLLVPADATNKVDNAESFLDQIANVYMAWNGPSGNGPAERPSSEI